MHTTRCLLSVAALALACGPQAPASRSAEPGPGALAPGKSAPAQGRDPSLVSLDGEAMQIYYQFVDARGRVRFVPTLDEVPVEWRERVGFVEMSSPPPGSPAEAQRQRDRRTASVAVPTRGAASTAPASGARADVILYGADWCGACRMAKSYMDEKGIAYEERNVDEPRWAEEMRSKAGPGGIPVIDVGGQIMRGFNSERLDQLLTS